MHSTTIFSNNACRGWSWHYNALRNNIIRPTPLGPMPSVNDYINLYGTAELEKKSFGCIPFSITGRTKKKKIEKKSV